MQASHPMQFRSHVSLRPSWKIRGGIRREHRSQITQNYPHIAPRGNLEFAGGGIPHAEQQDIVRLEVLSQDAESQVSKDQSEQA